ncbi:Uncharacterized protein dnl_49130 [Desulfonema limicola]|uniref:Nickel transport protein n=1 Tax=Desulfonema limicola TaxID=45656 RepID=A0A975BBZ1_9BACT|nr:hypothetical protein [Desulfonema limicola]QTA82536.1 Uncharacterized protein dnl_49130 [Desulfonema limicola]
MQKNKKIQSGLILVIFILIINPVNVFAHKVMVFAWVDGNTVHTESKFSGGRKVKQGQVNVFDSQGKELLTGITDDNGEFSFEIPRKTDLIIELMAGTGHRGEWTIKADEIGDGVVKPQDIQSLVETKQEPETNIKTASQADTGQITYSEIQIMMEKTLDKKLKPVLSILADSQEKGPSISDIFGGIGYIFGLMGIVMYFKAKQVKEKS